MAQFIETNRGGKNLRFWRVCVHQDMRWCEQFTIGDAKTTRLVAQQEPHQREAVLLLDGTMITHPIMESWRHSYNWWLQWHSVHWHMFEQLGLPSNKTPPTSQEMISWLTTSLPPGSMETFHLSIGTTSINTNPEPTTMSKGGIPEWKK